MHSFQEKGHKRMEFALKAHLFKAFNTLNWTFLEGVLLRSRFPRILITLIMFFVTNFKFKINLNEAIDGCFITPKRGLRQGCPLSLYLLIQSMEVLSRQLTMMNQTNCIGVMLSPQAPPLTHNFYADDVILFGKTDEQEASTLMKILEMFGSLSGLKVNKKKSII
jgi:Reverse transcriptase (RNA-dependent DNA polymerase)